ncbi:MAG: sigma-70 family RNA polymerase sigma factor [Proteobacteria bacterium]|nr:sigma-70 family RNA polymerase sigma factor [Pseudomonadota bacterium]
MTAGGERLEIADELDHAFEQHRGLLWGLAYRMTGSAADADDLVQETFARALAKPPRDRNRPWRPWLVRVQMNLARDWLRRRRRRGYVGPWLPEPIDLEQIPEPSFEPRSTEHRYELLESVSYAFLVALEALTPSQRAVLLLRDVLEYSGAEAAEALDMSEVNVRTTLGRARRRMADYDAHRCVPSDALRAETEALLIRFATALTAGDVDAVETLLADDVVALNDGGGVFAAARVPVRGRNKVARFHRGLLRAGAPSPRLAVRVLNGLPAVVGEYEPDPERPHLATHFVQLFVPDGAGKLRGLHTVVAPVKLGRVVFEEVA